jgi:hypothetical protein
MDAQRFDLARYDSSVDGDHGPVGRAIRTALAATVAGSVTTAPGVPRGASRPSGRYARSGKPSVTTASPSAAATRASTEPGWHRTGRPPGHAAAASTTAAACSRSTAAVL